MPGKGEEIRTQRLYVDCYMGDALRAVDDDDSAFGVRPIGNFANRVYQP